jgi:hypothetical protein
MSYFESLLGILVPMKPTGDDAVGSQRFGKNRFSMRQF